jgi:hypothetical protein
VIVSPLWNRDTGELSVAVVDTGGGVFDLVLALDECPLDAFYHPYAYAAPARPVLTKKVSSRGLRAMSRERAAQR